LIRSSGSAPGPCRPRRCRLRSPPYIEQFGHLRDEEGHRLVVRNGSAEPRTVLTSAGAVQVTAPRVIDKRTDAATGERMRFSSAILPPWARRTPQISEVLPLLYLHGLSSGDFVPALGQFLGSHAGLSASVVTRLTEQWQEHASAFMTRDLSGVDYVYLWVDGIHLGIRLAEGKLCLLVIIGVRADGRKELVALADGYREFAESWCDLLRDCARRGMRAPVLAIGDGALGFWKAAREVFPQAATQRCWFHKIANVLGALPKSAHPGAKKALAEIWNAEDKDHARAAVKAFAAAYGARFPKAAAKVTEDEDDLLAFYDYPAEHWVHLRTTNPISSPPSPLCGSARRSPRATGRRPPRWRWRSSSSSPRSAGGAWSTPRTWSPSSAPELRSSTASWSSDPMTSRHRQATRHRTPPTGRSPKQPKDLDAPVLAITSARQRRGPGLGPRASLVHALAATTAGASGGVSRLASPRTREALMTCDEPVDEFSEEPTPPDEVIHVCRVPGGVGIRGEIRQCSCGELYVCQRNGTWDRMRPLDRFLNRRKLARMGYSI
jgi:transposase-like protein